MSQIIILAWDALDIELLDEYGMANSFGAYQTTIDTYINPIIDDAHTREVWPSMITGVSPDVHGIHAVSESDGVEWDAWWLNQLSDLANGIIPKSALNAIGKRLRARGAALDAKRPEYYQEQKVQTVFDDGGRAISIPNYETEYDRRHGLDANRDDVWGAILPNRDGAEGLEPDVPLETVMDVLGQAMGRRLGHTIHAIQRGHDVVWCWFGLLDTVGHINPTIDGSLQRDAYELARAATESVTAVAPDDATVVSLSDHGLQNGEHTHYATIASDDQHPVESVNHVFDVADWVDVARDGDNAQSGLINDEEVDTVETTLEELGYI